MNNTLFFLLPLLALQCAKEGKSQTLSDTSDSELAKQNQAVAEISVGGRCEDCDIMYVGMPKNIPAIDTSSAWNEKGRKLLVKGTVFKPDGKTPAPNIIIYYWQTDNNGLYSPTPEMVEKAKRHGHIRGWMKTGADGKFALYTIRPASYPDSQNPEHIHTLVKEPGLTEYYIDEWQFDDDPLLTADQRKHARSRGGSGFLKTTTVNGLQIAETNIYLGKNIPDYPSSK